MCVKQNCRHIFCEEHRLEFCFALFARGHSAHGYAFEMLKENGKNRPLTADLTSPAADGICVIYPVVAPQNGVDEA
jgi:hypothetical protein